MDTPDQISPTEEVGGNVPPEQLDAVNETDLAESTPSVVDSPERDEVIAAAAGNLEDPKEQDPFVTELFTELDALCADAGLDRSSLGEDGYIQFERGNISNSIAIEGDSISIRRATQVPVPGSSSKVLVETVSTLVKNEETGKWEDAPERNPDLYPKSNGGGPARVKLLENTNAQNVVKDQIARFSQDIAHDKQYKGKPRVTIRSGSDKWGTS